MKRLTVVSLILLSLNANAEQLSLDVGVYTKHINSGQNRNEDNKLIAIEYMNGNHGVHASSFTNTYNNQSYTVGGSYVPFRYKYAEFGVLYGVVSGYKKGQLPVIISSDIGLYIAPRLTLKYDITESLTIKSSAQLFGNAIVTSVGIQFKY